MTNPTTRSGTKHSLRPRESAHALLNTVVLYNLLPGLLCEFCFFNNVPTQNKLQNGQGAGGGPQFPKRQLLIDEPKQKGTAAGLARLQDTACSNCGGPRHADKRQAHTITSQDRASTWTMIHNRLNESARATRYNTQPFTKSTNKYVNNILVRTAVATTTAYAGNHTQLRPERNPRTSECIYLLDAYLR